MSDEQEAPQDTAPEVEEDAPKKSPAKKASMAYMGKPFHPEDIPTLPPKPQWTPTHDSNYYVEAARVDNYDFYDMQAVNQAINRARVDIFQAKEAMDAARRELTDAETLHRHAYNRALVGISGGTEKTRVAAAELLTENEYTHLIVARAKFEELKALQYRLSDDLQVLQTLASNMRAQVNLR